MSRYKTYSDTKPSAISWSDKIPAWWDEKRLKYLFIQQSRPVRADDSIVTCFRDGQVTLRSNRRTEGFTNALKEHGYQGVRVGDLVIHSMDAFAGAIGVSDSDGKMSPVCTIALPAHSGTITSFYAYMLRAMAITGFIESLAKGIRERSTDFRWGEAREVTLPVPTDTEQSQIATFLDRETTRIDTLIEKKQRFIELLEEKRQAVITHAVTKGLDPNVPMRDSGVEWIGEVPVHWEVKRVGRVFSVVAGHPFRSMLFATEGIPIVRMSNLLNGVVSHRCVRRIQREYVPDTAYAKAGDLLVGLSGSITNYALVNEDDLPCAVNQRVGILRGEKGIELMGYIATTSIFTDQISAATNEAIIQNVSMEDVRSCRIPWPHNDERDDILRFLDRETTRIDALIEKTRESIELLKERRAALITAAVTGKMDVREEAAA